MYWTDWGKKPKIESSFMDGTHRRILLNASLVWPNGITIDKKHSKLYWVDAGLDRIEECDLAGGNRKVVLQQKNIHPFGLALYDGNIFWSDLKRREILKVEIGSGRVEKLTSGLAKPLGIHAYERNVFDQGLYKYDIAVKLLKVLYYRHMYEFQAALEDI